MSHKWWAAKNMHDGKGINWRSQFTLYIDTINKFIDIAKIARASDHPLINTVNHLRQLLDVGIPTDDGMLHVGRFGPTRADAIESALQFQRTMFSLGIDSMYWLGPHGSYIPILEQDSGIKKFLSTRLPKIDVCEDVLAELYYWGWLKAREFSVELTEDEGMPDMKVSGHGFTFHAEVKAIRGGTNPNRVVEVIKKANKQIKKTSEQLGICAIRYIEPITTNGDQSEIPTEIREIADLAHKAMYSSNYKSVSKTIIFWDEFTTRGQPPGWMLLYGVRRSICFEHQHARTPLPLTKELEPLAAMAGNMLFR